LGFVDRHSNLIIALAVVAVVLVAVAPSALQTLNRPESIEIREYNGQNLSSINDFRENSIHGVQYLDNQTYRLTLTGLVMRNMTYTYEDVISKYPHHEKVVTLDCVEGWSVTILWEGVSLRDLFQEAGVEPTANTVIFYAYDGYSTSFPLDYIVGNNIIMAYKMNGVVLPPARGFPFQLVAESKWGYKWIKWITKIELSDDPSYKGYWESLGYSNSGDLDKPFLIWPPG
jgi:DMSO/TMAO reductase YedYZ molybdopterin-dependent catalytic subunit